MYPTYNGTAGLSKSRFERCQSGNILPRGSGLRQVQGDQRCVISHRTAEEGGLQACHIIPRCHSARVRDPLQSDPPNTCSLQYEPPPVP